ncbi:MAG: OsmC family protein [Desulfitobacterium sp.]|nr:OsmC family protein [Desulfitobacterium sp.]
MKVTVSHIKGIHFEGEGSSKLRTQMDQNITSGGSGYGSSPMELILMALGGCTGMDVVLILEKMKVTFDRMEIIIVGERNSGTPLVFTDIELIYKFWGENLPEKKIQRAIQLSMEKYSSVANMLDKAVNITYRLDLS